MKIILRGAVAEWWPSSAKLVLDRKYERGVHAHDYEQVMRYLTKAWNLEERPPDGGGRGEA